MDAASYNYFKSKNHKLEFSVMDIECQLYTPIVKRASKLDGITKIPGASKAATPLGVGGAVLASDPNQVNMG